MQAKFTIGSAVRINGREYQVVNYHRINNKWEVLFYNKKRGHLSVPISILERSIL